MIKKIDDEGTIMFELNGMLHRPNGPAIIWNDGDWGWNLFGLWHRYYGPRDESGDWYIHDVLVL